MKYKIILLFALAFLPLQKGFHAETDLNNAQAIFIYNFLSNVSWPEGAVGSKYVLGVLGKTSTYDYLVKYTNQRIIGNRTIEVAQYSVSDEVKNCNVLFVAYGKTNEISTVKEKLNGKSCLIVGEKPGSTKVGAVIDFNVIDGKLRYKINEENAKQQNLLISASLLQMGLK